MKKFLLSVLITLLTVCCFGLFAACDEAGTPSTPSIPITTPGGGDGGGDSGETETPPEEEKPPQSGGLQCGGIFEGH